MKLCYTEQSSASERWIENIYVEQEGELTSSIAQKLILDGEMKCYSDEGTVKSELWCIGDFVFLNRDCRYLYFDGLLLCFYEPKHPLRSFGDFDGSEKFWPYIRLRYSTDRSSLLTRNGAVYISPNPASADMRFQDSTLKAESWSDTTSSGRWLFPNPEGSLAAYEHMRSTTLQDDFQRLASLIAHDPEVQATFSDL